jgi:alpha-1,2-glucosyltransferase
MTPTGDRSVDAGGEPASIPRPVSFPGRLPTRLLWLFLAALYLVATWVAMRGVTPYADELVHFPQIDLFRQGIFRIASDFLTTTPGYHAASAAIMALFGGHTVGDARAVNALFGVIAIGGFYALRRTLHPGSESPASMQFAVLPLLAPLFFVVYTDVLSLALILWAAVATFNGRHWWSAAVLLVALGVRQNNVLWTVFLAWLVAWPSLREDGLAAWRGVLARTLPYLVPLAAFFVYWLWNGSISLNRPVAHPDLTLHAGNVFCLLFLMGALFPLHVAAGLAEFPALVRRHPLLAIVPLLVFAAFWWGYQADHRDNAVMPEWFLRNGLVMAASTDPVTRGWTALVAALGVAGWMSTRLRPREAYWLVPFSIGFLSLSWLIEQRYALIPLAFWLAFRPMRGRFVEWANFALWLAVTVLVVQGTLRWKFFL